MDFDKSLINTVTDRDIAFSSTPVTYDMLSPGNIVVNPVHLLVIKPVIQGIPIKFYCLNSN